MLGIRSPVFHAERDAALKTDPQLPSLIVIGDSFQRLANAEGITLVFVGWLDLLSLWIVPDIALGFRFAQPRLTEGGGSDEKDDGQQGGVDVHRDML
jgi:hypothetical protein